MPTYDLQSEIEESLLLKREIAQKVKIVVRLIELIQSGKYSSSSFYYVPFTGPSIFEGGSVIHPDIKILNRDLTYLMSLLKEVQVNIEDTEFIQFKEWTQGEIERFNLEVKNNLNKLSRKQRKTGGTDSDEETEKTFKKLIQKSNSIINYLVIILGREPTKKNIQSTLKGVCNNFILGGNNKDGLKAVEDAVLKRLRWALNNYHPEKNPRDFAKFIEAYEGASIFVTEHPLLSQAEKKLSSLEINRKTTKRKKIDQPVTFHKLKASDE